MNKNILVLGNGFIGARLAASLDCKISGRRINSLHDAEDEISRQNFDVIINCIGYTGDKNVDDCECNKDKTFIANTFVPVILAEAASKFGKKFIHLSSGCIYKYDYAHQSPIAEDLPPDFFNLAYSRSKIYAEEALKRMADEFNMVILRIRIPLDDRPHPKNLLTKLINYSRVIDIPNSVTYIPDFIRAVRHLIRVDAKGIFNVVNKGGLRYPVLMETYRRHVSDFSYEVIRYEDLKLLRTNLLLSADKLENSGFPGRNINEVLEECVKNYLRCL